MLGRRERERNMEGRLDLLRGIGAQGRQALSAGWEGMKAKAQRLRSVLGAVSCGRRLSEADREGIQERPEVRGAWVELGPKFGLHAYTEYLFPLE